MGCILPILAYFLPRLLMVFIFLLTDWFGRAYQTWYWPLLGFIFMPYTTLAYMAAELHGGLEGGWIVLLVVAVLFDLGGQGESARSKRRRRR